MVPCPVLYLFLCSRRYLAFMLTTEAVIAWIAGTLFLSYSILKRQPGSEGMGLVAALWGAVLFVAIPLTIHFIP